MRWKLADFRIRNRVVKLVLVSWGEKDLLGAIGSGIPWREPQYLLLDYDENYEMEQWEFIVEEYSLRRALVVESSPEKYWFASFSPMHIADIAEIMFHSTADKRHCASLLRDGYAAIRFYRKPKWKGYPRIKNVINNRKGTNFYNWNMEKAFGQLLKEYGR